ncbi:hypothetical protein M5G07_02325 [Serratia symbiotica]|nr:hypothetical protein [Serratia symbiotica]
MQINSVAQRTKMPKATAHAICALSS